MSINITAHVTVLLAGNADVQFIKDSLNRLETLMTQASDAIDRLATSVASLETEEDSILALVDGLAAAMRANAADADAINGMADKLDADRQKITDKVLENTPAEPAQKKGNKAKK